MQRSFQEGIRAYMEEKGLDPWRFMADTMADETLARELRLHAAIQLASWIQPKLKSVEVEVGPRLAATIIHKYGKE